jgi:hypothetical protein
MSDGALRQLLLRARTTLRAAATALTPYPMISWLAGGQEATAARVAEVAVGAGGAGVALKAGVAALAAGAVVAGGPALRGDHQPAPRRPSCRRRRPSPAAPARVLHRRPRRHEAGDQGGPRPITARTARPHGSSGDRSGHHGTRPRTGRSLARLGLEGPSPAGPIGGSGSRADRRLGRLGREQRRLGQRLVGQRLVEQQYVGQRLLGREVLLGQGVLGQDRA